MVAHLWNMLVGSSMYGCDPIMVALSENTVAPHICAIVKYSCITYQSGFSMFGRKLRPTVVGCGLAFLPGALPDRNVWVQYGWAQAKGANKSLCNTTVSSTLDSLPVPVRGGKIRLIWKLQYFYWQNKDCEV